MLRQSMSKNVVEIFTEVAPKYEFLNSLLTAGRDRYWREELLRLSEAALGKTPSQVLDLATGTGDIPRLMQKRWPQADILGTDPTQAMLNVARTKSTQGNLRWELGVAEKIEAQDNSLDLITIAFGFRNVAENLRLQAAQEAFRKLRPGGVFAILELGLPEAGPAQKIYRSLLRYGMPIVAGIFAPRGPYKYLAQSICEFPPPDNIRRMLNKAGLVPYSPRPLSGGMCWLYIGKKPEAAN